MVFLICLQAQTSLPLSSGFEVGHTLSKFSALVLGNSGEIIVPNSEQLGHFCFTTSGLELYKATA